MEEASQRPLQHCSGYVREGLTRHDRHPSSLDVEAIATDRMNNAIIHGSLGHVSLSDLILNDPDALSSELRRVIRPLSD